MNAEDIIRELDMTPHPEGGHYVESFRDNTKTGDRDVSTAIYFLLQAGEVSHWHRVDAAEVWHHYAGAPLCLSISAAGATSEDLTLGLDLTRGERPQLVVPPGHWQAARSLGDWTLVGCTVAPAFEFEKFEMAPPGWSPGLPK
jgi:uncharacterized protein